MAATGMGQVVDRSTKIGRIGEGPMLTPERQEKLARHAYVSQWASIIAAVGAIITVLVGAYTTKINADRDIEIERIKQGQAQISRQVATAADNAQVAAKAAAKAVVAAESKK